LVNFFKGLWLGLSLPFKKLFNLPAFNLGERIDGVSLVYDLAAIAEKKGYSIFLLGGWPTNFWGKPLSNPGYDLAEKAGKNLVKLYPNLRLIGATSDFSYKEKEDASTITFIKEKMQKANVEKIDILIVCYGHKNQEKWIARNASKIPARLAMGAGGSFDYISGEKSWAPKWIKELHVEWLYRLITQPWRLKRVFMSFPVFPIKVFLHSLKPRN
jgi:N-acetylglucosaminyldiphosphoundecaprenol N-acetyl-beta-D-mannosaminyltransferase